MPDYKLGKIYQIWSPNTDKVYIGSTTQPLHKRFSQHNKGLTGKKYVYSRKVLECGDACIELIEEYPCANKSELNRREGQVMRGYDNRVNRNIAGRTTAEWRADNKERKAAQDRERYLREKEHVLAQNRERYLRKKEHIAAQPKEYQEDVKARRAAQVRERYWRKKEHIAAQVKEYSQRPEIKERRNALARERRQRKKEQQQTTST